VRGASVHIPFGLYCRLFFKSVQLLCLANGRYLRFMPSHAAACRTNRADRRDLR
jgi:hypothetical protein